MYVCVDVCIYVLVYWERRGGEELFLFMKTGLVSLCSSCFHGTCFVNQAGLEFRELHVSSCSARLKGMSTIPARKINIFDAFLKWLHFFLLTWQNQNNVKYYFCLFSMLTVMWVVIVLVWVNWDRVLLYNSSWLWTHSFSASSSYMRGSQVWIIHTKCDRLINHSIWTNWVRFIVQLLQWENQQGAITAWHSVKLSLLTESTNNEQSGCRWVHKLHSKSNADISGIDTILNKQIKSTILYYSFKFLFSVWNCLDI